MRRRLARRTPSLLILLLLSHAVAATRAVAQVEPAPQAPPEEQAAEAVTLSLRDALTASLESNLDIAVRRYDPLMAEARLTGLEAAFDPSMTGNALSSDDEQRRVSTFIGPFSSKDKGHSYSASFQDPLTTGGSYRLVLNAIDNSTNTTNLAGSTFSTGFNTTWQVTFIQPLLRNMGRKSSRYLILVGRNDVGANGSIFRQSVLDTLSAAERAYWDLNFALMDLKTKRASLQLAKDFLEQNRIKVRVGTLAPIEITQAEAGVADREEGVILAENAVRTAEDALRRVMNVPRDSPMWSKAIRPSDAPPLEEVTPDMEASVAAAEKNRPDLEQARLGVRSRETELAYRKNQRRWGLDFQGDYGLLGFDEFTYHTSFDDLRDRNQKNWSLSLTLSVPIGNRQAIASFTEAEHRVNQARYDLLRLEQAARIEVRNAVRTVETNLKRVKAAQVNVRLQREKLAAEQKKFENGMSTSFQVLQFQTDLTTAESRENQAIVDFNKSLVDLERAKGTLLEAKGMVLPGTTPGPGGPAEQPASAGPSAALGERLTLPEAFVFDGRRLVGLGGGRAGASR
jgi:outer membrane protein